MRTVVFGVVSLLALCLLACGGVDSPVAAVAEAGLETVSLAAAPVAAVEPEADPLPPVTIPRGPLAGHRVCIDPGHDAYWAVGASAGTSRRHPVDGIALHEHELTLSVAYRLKGLLEADEAAVCLTRLSREEGGGLQAEPYDFTGDGRVRTLGRAIEDTPEVIQPRIDWANQFGAEVLVSLHFNGSEDRRLRGTEVYFTDGGPRRDAGHALASSLLESLLGELRVAGYPAIDRGVRSDAYQRYTPEQMRRFLQHNAATIRANGYDPAACAECYRLVTIGNNPMSLHAGSYVAALVEVDFLSSPEFVEGFLLRPDAFDVIAAGLHGGLRRYFAVD